MITHKKYYVNIKTFVTNTQRLNSFFNVLSSLPYLYDVYFRKTLYEMLSVLVSLTRASHNVCSFQIHLFGQELQINVSNVVDVI